MERGDSVWNRDKIEGWCMDYCGTSNISAMTSITRDEILFCAHLQTHIRMRLDALLAEAIRSIQEQVFWVAGTKQGLHHRIRICDYTPWKLLPPRGVPNTNPYYLSASERETFRIQLMSRLDELFPGCRTHVDRQEAEDWFTIDWSQEWPTKDGDAVIEV